MVVLPVGPDNDGAETIQSLFTYCTSSLIVLAVDDSKLLETRHFLETCDPRVIRLPSAGYPGIRGGLLCSLARAYQYALAHYDFDVLLRIDTDALITGPAPEEDALALFAGKPKAGMLGPYRVGYDGGRRDFGVVADMLRHETGWHGLRRFSRRRRLKAWLSAASALGYEPGEHILGAAIYLRVEALRAMHAAGDLNVDEFHDSGLSEDHIFSLLTVRHGYMLEDFVTGDLPMGVRWRGLPDSPRNLLARGKKIVHSIKFYESMKEPEIRAFFAQERAKHAASSILNLQERKNDPDRHSGRWSRA
ncbi:hypothetical protein CDN99_14570 [Roseateles aquatilis]|uniref:Glycosyltransferase 2-like domain-containing protein n=2 Tax=Roseateles aquatilis TaxID=431061 RepID=A0A246J850_9BURK|nr:hypothetical protein CDN99_14570 [Roseateles aquatilis]